MAPTARTLSFISLRILVTVSMITRPYKVLPACISLSPSMLTFLTSNGKLLSMNFLVSRRLLSITTGSMGSPTISSIPLNMLSMVFDSKKAMRSRGELARLITPLPSQ
jgi:hypothetical protein